VRCRGHSFKCRICRQRIISFLDSLLSRVAQRVYIVPEGSSIEAFGRELHGRLTVQRQGVAHRLNPLAGLSPKNPTGPQLPEYLCRAKPDSSICSQQLEVARQSSLIRKPHLQYRLHYGASPCGTFSIVCEGRPVGLAALNETLGLHNAHRPFAHEATTTRCRP